MQRLAIDSEYSLQGIRAYEEASDRDDQRDACGRKWRGGDAGFTGKGPRPAKNCWLDACYLPASSPPAGAARRRLTTLPQPLDFSEFRNWVNWFRCATTDIEALREQSVPDIPAFSIMRSIFARQFPDDKAAGVPARVMTADPVAHFEILHALLGHGRHVG